MDKRTLLAVVLSLALLMGYQYFFPNARPFTPKPAQQTGEISVEGQATTGGDEAIQKAPVIAHQKSLVTKDEDKGTGKDVVVEGALYTAIFNSRGAGLKSFKLKGYRKDLKKDSALVEMVGIGEGTRYPLASTFPESSIDIPADVLYEASADSIDFTDAAGTHELVFSWSYPGALRVEKLYTFYPDRFSFDLEVRVTNLSDDTIKEQALLTWNRYFDPEGKGDKYSHEGPISFVKNKAVSEKIKNLGEKKFSDPDVSWGGFETKYFIAAMIPEQPSLTRFAVSKDSGNMV
ncbi:MAG: membrane protein insertase YidC, partial [Candidatus Altiarchaeota archaeon]|nr:membrane protein insertase YidC [Candidatus Altiarchaeota archaeon]